MSIKNKLILIGICAVIIIVVFTVNVVKKLSDEKEKGPEDTIVENVMTQAEAYRLLSYLEYDKAGRDAIPLGITYAKEDYSGWYNSYVNAVWKMGLIDGNVATTPDSSLTYGACKELIDKLIMKRPELQTVYTGLSFDFTKAGESMLIPQFLELYLAILEVIPEEEQLITEETLLVLGREISEDGKDRMVTDLGKYYYLAAKDYIEFYSAITAVPSLTPSPMTSDSAEKDTEEDGRVAASDKADTNKTDTSKDTEITRDTTNAKEADNTANTDAAMEVDASGDSKLSLIEQFLDKGIRVFVCEQEILFIADLATEKIVIHNVWIKQGTGTGVDTFINGLDKSFSAKYKLSSDIEKVVGDITIENQKIVQISVKPDMIRGKVLRSGEDFIEVEGYGDIPLDENYKIYKIFGELSMEPTGSILVGYENTDFIVSQGRISAALITGSIKAKNIRVLIRTSSFKDIRHEKVEFTANSDFTLSNNDTETSYKKGDVVSVEPGSELLAGGRITIKPVSEDAKIELSSIERSYGKPKYRGTIEIVESEGSLLIVNELPLEEYLYAVIPSEMPTYYGIEALKVQAVCARSYAYIHLMANSLNTYGAHVDDSVSYQVYNNIAENEDSILAVKDTYGKVIKYEDKVITAYYFSTSSGHTAPASSVWAYDVDYPYIVGKLLLVEEEGEGSEPVSDAEELYADLSSEETFRSFMEAKDFKTYDSGFNWYRWKVTMDVSDIKKVIDSNLKKRYNAKSELILTMTKEAKDGEEAVFESIPVDTVGDVVDIQVLKRESSGILSELLIVGTKNTIKVYKEYNIRALLAPAYDVLTRQDDTKVENLSVLPSAFFVMDKNMEGKKLSSITLTGGGYGHGVGMSQNGVKALTDAGKKYEEITSYFYEGTKLGYIYE